MSLCRCYGQEIPNNLCSNVLMLRKDLPIVKSDVYIKTVWDTCGSAQGTGFADTTDISNEEALALYDKYITATKELMYAKNHDYGEAWRGMRISSYTDLILMKLYRTKQIESHGGKTIVSEGIDANYMDMINYALFGLIKLEYGEETVEN